MAAADDEPEIAWTGRCDESGTSVPGEGLDDRDRILAALGHPGAAHGQTERHEVYWTADRALVDAGEVIRGQTGRSPQKVVHVQVRLPNGCGSIVTPPSSPAAMKKPETSGSKANKISNDLWQIWSSTCTPDAFTR